MTKIQNQYYTCKIDYTWVPRQKNIDFVIFRSKNTSVESILHENMLKSYLCKINSTPVKSIMEIIDISCNRLDHESFDVLEDCHS